MTTKMIPKREEIPDDQKWDLTPLFETVEAWENLYTQLENELEAYLSFKGRLADSLTVLKEALEFHLSVSRQVERLYTYAHLRSDEDKSNQFYLGLYQRAINLFTRTSELSSFITPEIQSIPNETIKKYMALLEQLCLLLLA